MSKPKRKRESRRVIFPENGMTNFSVQEAFNAVRTNLQFAVSKKGCRRVIVTSALPYEGKTTCCAYLAVALSQMKAKTLVIDCDMRKPTMHKLFSHWSIPGLSDVLGGMFELEEALQETQYENLHAIFSGTIPPNPGELLGSAAMAELIEKLSEEYDYILMDTPPVNVVSDAIALSPAADGIMLVAWSGHSTHPEMAQALSSIEFANAKVLGVVLNGVEPSKGSGYKNYRYGKYGKYGKYGGYYSSNYYSKSSNSEK